MMLIVIHRNSISNLLLSTVPRRSGSNDLSVSWKHKKFHYSYTNNSQSTSKPPGGQKPIPKKPQSVSPLGTTRNLSLTFNLALDAGNSGMTTDRYRETNSFRFFSHLVIHFWGSSKSFLKIGISFTVHQSFIRSCVKDIWFDLWSLSGYS